MQRSPCVLLGCSSRRLRNEDPLPRVAILGRRQPTLRLSKQKNYRTIRTVLAAIEARATWPNTARRRRPTEHGPHRVEGWGPRHDPAPDSGLRPEQPPSDGTRCCALPPQTRCAPSAQTRPRGCSSRKGSRGLRCASRTDCPLFTCLASLDVWTLTCILPRQPCRPKKQWPDGNEQSHKHQQHSHINTTGFRHNSRNDQRIVTNRSSEQS